MLLQFCAQRQTRIVDVIITMIASINSAIAYKILILYEQFQKPKNYK